MPSKRATASHPEYTFVNVDLASTERPRRTTQARAHTARVIRQRQTRDPSTQHATNARPANAVVPEMAGKTSSTSSARILAPAKSSTHSSQSPPIIHEDGCDWPENQQLAEKLPSPRPLSPVFGALTVDAFDAGTSGAAVEAADYCLNIDWPNLLTPEETAVWFQLFCKQPVIFHGFNYASATHGDILRNQVSRSSRRDMLAHKTQCFHLLRELVANLNDDNVELVLFAVMIMWHYDLRDEEIGDTGSLPFTPHLPGANWLSVYGRTTGVEAHTRPLMNLLDRAGGIGNLKQPGLAFAISCGDMIAASIANEKPGLPLFWKDAPSVDEAAKMLHMPPLACSGYGFATLVPRGLPSMAVSVLLEVCAVDGLLTIAKLRRLKSRQHKMIVDVRNAAQYRLLSLPSWDELEEDDRTERSRTAYELCILTAVLYSNAVIFPLPLNTGWHRRLITRIRDTIEHSTLSSSSSNSSMLIWSLFVGGIAAYRSHDRAWFEMNLQAALARARIYRWNDAEMLLTAFMWSRDACRMGAAVLWDALDVEDKSRSTSVVAIRSQIAL
ncbi:hypothetical protein LTR56_014643 [Elasticomyces elasticus]|nr:hypothetical protein LTR56_014643 [Elasticomyces elasticus]KAK3645320.1 hypothetical protein LTR22_014785 [Elasticomyces elasticus]KAK4919838.1 hypothetical protein LTR49_012585 [Elasticomyces elasticus]KAK5750091.1 hypothetical protein LTS12_019817 [Elasticomyces elasticus]